MQSIRASVQSTSIKRLSEQSNKSMNVLNALNTSGAIMKTEMFHKQDNCFLEQSSEHSVKTSMSNDSSMEFSNPAVISVKHNTDQELCTMSQEKDINNSTCSRPIEQRIVMSQANSIELSSFDDSVFVLGSSSVANEKPPALPVKTRSRGGSSRRERHISQYDNVEETDSFSK